MSIKVINNQETCRKLTEMLDAKGITPTEIKERLQLQSVQAVYKWYATAKGSGSKSIPSMDNMVLLADMLDVTINDILVCNDVNV